MDKDVLTAINDISPTFSKGQRRIAAYISKNYDKAAFMTAGKLGNAAGVSESTVVRFAADLGYDGYPSMRRALQELIKNRLTTVQRIEVARDLIPSGNVLESVLNSDMDKLRHTLEEVDRTSFEDAVNAIAGAGTIYVVGLRSSSALAGFMGFYLNLLFPDVRLVNQGSGGDIYEKILHVGSDDVFIGISFPRYSRMTIKAMEFAKEQGATVIGITDSESSLVAKAADIKLFARSEMVSFLDSLVAPLSLINAIIVAAAQRTTGDLEANFNNLEKLWAENEVYEKHDG